MTGLPVTSCVPNHIRGPRIKRIAFFRGEEQPTVKSTPLTKAKADNKGVLRRGTKRSWVQVPSPRPKERTRFSPCPFCFVVARGCTRPLASRSIYGVPSLNEVCPCEQEKLKEMLPYGSDEKKQSLSANVTSLWDKVAKHRYGKAIIIFKSKLLGFD